MAKLDLAQPISDVARPGKSVPSASSKQIIITNRPIIKDPMMTPVSSETPATSVGQTINHGGAKPPRQVTPPSNESVQNDSSFNLQIPVPDKYTSSPSPVSDEPPANEAAADQAANEIPEPAATTGPLRSDEALDALDATNPDLLDAKAAADTLHQQTIEELIEKETYFLPIASREQKRARRITIFGVVLIIILAAAWADVALDAGLLQIDGVHAPTHFFSN